MAGALEVGDFLPEFQLWDHKGRLNALSNVVRGKAIVVLFYPGNDRPACQRLLRSFAAQGERLTGLAHVFAITPESPEANAAAPGIGAVPFALLSDPGRQAAAAYGIGHNLEPERVDFMGLGAFTSFVADPNRRILMIGRDVTDADHATRVVELLERRVAAETPREIGPVAPVLYVPRVFDPGFCARLIAAHERGETRSTGTLSDAAGGGRAVKDDAARKVRRDHFVRDPALRDAVTRLVGRRVLPEIAKAFSYRVTRFDDFKIGCYEAEAGGHFGPHRDNNNVSAVHRRFAMSLNLNAGDYAGGQLRFPEYGPHLYSPATGDAVVFSCSLLHEALPVTAGRRYVLLSFFFGEEAQRMAAQRAGVG